MSETKPAILASPNPKPSASIPVLSRTSDSSTPASSPPATPPSPSGASADPELVYRPTNLLSVGFNQDYGCFACATDSGFRIYNCDPFRKTFRREFYNGGIGLVEMLFRCNILALVGGGTTPRFPPNKVMIWDDHQSRCIGELSFRSEVRAVRLRRDRIVVILEHKIYVYNFADLKLLHQIETMANPKGLCALSPASSSLVLACPGLQKGQVRVEHYNLKKTKFITAHDSRLACFALTQDGRLLATASIKGTLIRVFNTFDGTRLQELRRGADRAEIYSIAFSPSAQWLALSSDKGTVHVFSLNAPAAMEGAPKVDSAQVNSGTSAQGPTNTGGNGGGNPVAGTSPLTVPSGNPNSSLSFMKVLRWLAPSGEEATALSIEERFGHPFSLNVPAVSEDGHKVDSPPVVMGTSAHGSTDTGGNGVGSPGAGTSPLTSSSGNPSSSLSFMKGVLPSYFSSEWSFAQYRLPNETRAIVAFGPQKHTVVIVGMDGSFYRCIFDPVNGGEMIQQEYTKFMRAEEEDVA